MVVFKHFPKLHPVSKDEQHLVPLKERSKYPSLAGDFVTLDQELMPTFRELDNQALSQQNHYRWAYIILIFGGSLATIFGIVQIASPTIDWPGYVEAVIALILIITTTASRTFNNQERYLDKRLAAEELRSTYFLYLGHYSPYQDEHTRAANLHKQVEVIKRRARH